MKKIGFSVFFCIILIFSCFFPVSVSAYEITGVDIHAKSVLLASLDTNEIIYSKAADEEMYPAALSRIMTALILLEKTPDLDSEKLTVSHEALKLISGTGSAVSGLVEDEVITARDALNFLMVTAAGDIGYVIAEHYAPSVADFVNMMNEKAKEMGLNDTHFTNPHGLHDDDHYTTANDLYKMVKVALENPDFKKTVGTSRYKLAATNKHNARTLVTTNFLQDASTSYYYKYASGVKTGYTDKAGRCIISTATKNGYTYLLILLGCPSTADGVTARYDFRDSQNIYKWAFNNLEYKTAIEAYTAICETNVNNSSVSDHVTLCTAKDVATILPKGVDDSTVTVKTRLNSESVDAPVKKGDVLGIAEVYYADSLIGTADLIATEDVDENKLLTTFNAFKSFFGSTVFKVIVFGIVAFIVIFIAYIIHINRARKKRKRKVAYKPDKNYRKENGKH